MRTTTIAVIIGIVLLAGCGEPLVPVSIGARDAVMGSGQVLRIRATAPLTEVSILVQRGDEAKRFNVGAMGMDQAVEYGWAEGWAFEDGDKVTVTAKGFRTMVATVGK